MNTVYLENDFEDLTTENYLSKLVHMLNSQGINQRINKLLCSVAHDSSFPITHGLLEETELTIGIIVQIFFKANKLQKINNGFL